MLSRNMRSFSLKLKLFVFIQNKATISLRTFFDIIPAFSTYTFLLSFYRMTVSFKKTQFFAAFGAFSHHFPSKSTIAKQLLLYNSV